MSDLLLTVEHHGKTYAMTPMTLVNELTYANYRFNRQRSPEVTPVQWQRTILEFTPELEERYQREVHR